MNTKVIFLLICFSLFLNKLRAQNLSLQAGISFPSTSNYWQEFDETDNFVLNLGFIAGPTYEFRINELNGIKIGALLNLKGYNTVKSKKVTEFEASKQQFDLYYIDFPILYHRNFQLGNHVFFAEFGPYTGIGLKGKSKMEYYYNGVRQYEENNLFGKNSIDYLKKVDYGLLLSLGMNIKDCQLALSGSLGLRDISKPDFEKMKNRVIAMYISYPLFKIN